MGVTKQHLPFKGGSIVELYQVDGNKIYALNSPASEWVSSCLSDVEYNSDIPDGYKNIKILILTVTRILNDPPIKSDIYEFKVLINAISFSTLKPKLTNVKVITSQ